MLLLHWYLGVEPSILINYYLLSWLWNLMVPSYLSRPNLIVPILPLLTMDSHVGCSNALASISSMNWLLGEFHRIHTWGNIETYICGGIIYDWQLLAV